MTTTVIMSGYHALVITLSILSPLQISRIVFCSPFPTLPACLLHLLLLLHGVHRYFPASSLISVSHCQTRANARRESSSYATSLLPRISSHDFAEAKPCSSYGVQAHSPLIPPSGGGHLLPTFRPCTDCRLCEEPAKE